MASCLSCGADSGRYKRCERCRHYRRLRAQGEIAASTRWQPDPTNDVLIRELREARRAGAEFPDAWEHARAVAVASSPTSDDRRDWTAVYRDQTVRRWYAAEYMQRGHEPPVTPGMFARESYPRVDVLVIS
jgi:hypothetical protein